jgi:hypothetical protein
MATKTCRVSFRRADGWFCSVEVEAESVYEAAVLALSTLTSNELSEGVAPQTPIRVQVIEPGPTKTVAITEIRRWLEMPALNPSEGAMKRKLRGLLAS